MKRGDLVRNKWTIRDSVSDELGIVEVVKRDPIQRSTQSSVYVKVIWFPKGEGLVEYMTWMDIDDLELIKK